MQGTDQQLTGGRELNYITQRDNYSGSLIGRIIEAVNTLAKNAGVAAVGKVSPPNPIDSIQVQGKQVGNVITAPGEVLHYTLTHNQAVSKGVQYLSEIDTDPNFTQPHVIDHGSSRSAFLTLPTFKNDGTTPNVYYLRSYAQYHGSDPCKPTVFGGLGGAIQIKMSGLSGATPLPSTGSGTASPSGQQGGHGLGIVLDRPAPGPKRNIVA
jgi:hypothetical protein